uniref:Cyclic nucleotide-binding domain-containing protein n=1 Tax=Guillardia theta TaxID=55529 RepID=A0A7S4L5A0_GUITH|mmetsp:Transcript_37763/g.119302  ORF Transcript_37763/g.119302 Transcript_37763/m.119302 type:complete len:393 (+) Transcript_37763:154-1332(+)
MSDQGTVGVSKKEKVKQYLEASILPFLSQALTKLCAEEPSDPFEWLGRYLIENNPRATRKFDHKEALVLKLAQGDFFGEIALLHGKPRQATVKSVGSSTLLVLSRDAFNRLCGSLFDILQRNIGEYKDVEFMEEEPEEHLDDYGGVSEEEDYEEPPPPPVNMRRGRRDTVYLAATKVEDDWRPPEFPKTDEERDRIHKYIEKTALLSYLDPSSKDLVVTAVEKLEFDDGQDIISQGDEADYYYILDSGKADVLIAKPLGSDPVKVNEYGPGGSFGELALLHGDKRIATIRATEHCVTWALQRDTFRKLMMQRFEEQRLRALLVSDSDLQWKASLEREGSVPLQGFLLHRERSLVILLQVNILKELDHYEKFKIAEAMQMRKVEDDEVIVKVL